MNERNIKKVSISLLILLILIGLALGGVKIQNQREKDAHEANITKGAQFINESNRTLIGTQIQDDLNEMDILKQEDNCYVECKGANTTDAVKATLTLYQGKTYVDSWSGSGTGRVLLSGNCAVKSGKSYTLTLTYSINGTTKPSVSTTATCP